MYCNKMYWGHGVYGVEAASQLYFAKSVEGPHARRSGDDRGHSPEQRPAEPVQQHEGRDRAPQLRARPHGGQRLHHGPRRMPRQGETDRDARPADAAAVDRAVLPRDHSRAARSSATAPRRCTKAVSSIRTGLDPDLQRAANRRARRPACGDSTGCAATGSPRATSSPKSAPSTPTGIRAGRARFATGDIIPAVVTRRRPSRVSACASAG